MAHRILSCFGKLVIICVFIITVIQGSKLVIKTDNIWIALYMAIYLGYASGLMSEAIHNDQKKYCERKEKEQRLIDESPIMFSVPVSKPVSRKRKKNG